jgi:1-acyl-sn-glycerol-3-phosphate acyltransferase
MSPSSPKSLSLSARNIYEVFAVSWPTVVDALRGRVTKEVCDDRLAGFAAAVVKNARIELEVVGRENMVPGVTYLVMSNHQSLYDIPALFHVIGANLRMITKAELFKVPVFGTAMEEAGFISIDRSNRERAIASLAHAKAVLGRGVHVWIAPEGTRSRTGELLPFKKGGFILALETGLPILPVTLKGTRDVLRAKGVRSVAGRHVLVTIHPAIDPAPYTRANDRDGRKRLMEAVRRSLSQGL